MKSFLLRLFIFLFTQMALILIFDSIFWNMDSAWIAYAVVIFVYLVAFSLVLGPLVLEKSKHQPKIAGTIFIASASLSYGLLLYFLKTFEGQYYFSLLLSHALAWMTFFGSMKLKPYIKSKKS